MSKPTRILIVEDNPNDYDLALREIRKSLDSSVFKRVETYHEYLAELKSFQPDLILCDYSLPAFDGMQALRLVQERLPFTPLIIWTSSVNEKVVAECMKAGAHNYILKENITHLAPAVLHALDARQMLLERKQAEDKLSRSEMNYRALAENSLQGIAIFQKQGIVYVNSAMCAIMGYTADELLAMSQEQIFALTHPDDRAVARERASRREAGEDVSDVNDVRIIQKDGTIRWIQTFATSTEYDGQPAILATNIDITERKQAEEKLRAQERHFRALIENSLDSISLLSADGVLIWENPSVERALGYEPGEFINRSIFELMHPDDQVWTSSAFSQLTREPGSQQRGIFRLKHSDGTWRWIEATATNMLQEPSVQAIVINYRDITERKNAEQELSENQAKYRNLVETSHDLIWAVDAAGRFTFVNAAAREIYGYEPEEMIGQSYFSIMDSEHDHLTPETFRDAISGRNEYHDLEVYVQHQDGRQIILSANSIVLRDENGTVTGVTGTSRDITEQKRAEQALRKERNLLRTLIDHLPDRIYAMDRQGKKTLSNTADWQASGKKQMEDVIGKTDFDLYPPELAEPYWKLDHEVLESGQPVINYEEPGLDSEGNRVSVLTSKIPLRDESGNVIGLVGIGRDITEHKQTEEALRENEQRYRTLFENMPIAIWEEDFSAVKAYLDALKLQGITDVRAYFASHPEQVQTSENLFRILDVNHSAVEMYRAGTKERLIREALQERSRGEQEHGIEDLLAIADGRTSNSWEGADETCDGTSLEIQLNWSVVPGHERDYSKVIVTTIDVTENRRAQQAEREQRALAEALRDTAQLLNSTLDYGEVLDHILSAVERVAPHNAGTIMLIEEGFARVVRAHGYDKLGSREDILGVRLPLADTRNLRQILETRQPVIVSDTHTYPGWKRMEATEWLRSSVGAPISIRDEVIGFILLDSDTPGFFSPVHAERLKSFANQAALAIHNARLLQQARAEIAERQRTETELHHKNEDLRLLNVINNAVVRGQDLDSIIDLLTQELKRIFSAVGSTVYMLSVDKRSLTMHQYSFSPEIEQKIEKLIGFRIPKIEIPIKEGGQFYNVMLTKQSVITSDPQKIQEWITEFADTKFLPNIARAAVRKLVPHIYKLLHIGSTIIVPLISHEEVIGFLDVSSAGLFTASDLKRIETIGEQLTSLIQRQQVNEKVRKSEEFLQGIQNSLSAHIAILDERGTIIQVNEAWREFGDQNGLRNPDYCIGMNYFAVCESAGGPDAEGAKEIASAIHRVLSGETSEASLEYPSHSPMEKRWFTVHITCFDDGKQKWVILAHENITERKLIEEELRQSEIRYRTVIENQTEFIVRWRPDGTRSFVNDAYCRYFGFTREQALNASFLPLIYEEDHQFVEAKISRLLSGVSRVETDIHRVIRPDGSLNWNEWTDQALYDEDGQLVEFQAVGRDITERKRAEEELNRSHSLLYATLESTADGILVVDSEGKITNFNQKFLELWRIPRELAAQKNDRVLLDFVLEQLWNPSSFIAKVEKLYQSPEDISLDELQFRDGRVFERFSQPQRLGDAIVGRVWSFRDISERKRAENALQESQARYRDLFDKSPISLWEEDYSVVKRRIDALRESGVTDFNKYFETYPDEVFELVSQVRIIDVNRAALDLYHAQQKEDLLQNLAILLEKDSLLHFREELLGLMSPTRGFVWEDSDKTLEGQALDVIVTGTIPTGYEEDWSRVIISIADITERKQAETELRASEERFRQLATNIEEVFWMTEAETGKEIYASPAVEKIWGVPIETFLYEPDFFLNSILPEDQPIVMRGIEREKGGEKVELEYRIIHPDGSVHWIWDRAFPIFDEHGKVKTLAGISTEITERKRTEDALHESEEKLQNIIQHSGSMFYTHTSDHRLMYVSPQSRNILDCEPEEAIVHWQEFLSDHPANAQGIEATERAIQTGQRQPPYELELITRRNRKVWVHVDESPLVQDGKIVAIVGSLTDITERKQNEMEIQRHLAELEALYENGLAIGRLLEPEEIGTQIIQTFAHHLSWHHVAIRLLNPETSRLELIAFNQPGLSDESRAEVEMRFTTMVSSVGQGLSGWAMQTGTSIRTGNVHTHPQYVNTQKGIMSGLYMPLKAGDRIIGSISVESDQPDAFTAQDERLLATLANQAAIAFENARLYQAAQQELSERKRAQQALWASETHYRQLADSITDVLFELDQNLCYTHWNKASEMFSGIPAEDVIGRSIRDVFGTSDEQLEREDIYRSVLQERQARIFETAVIAQGQERHLEISAYPSARGVSVVARDITERKLSESLLRKRFELIEYSSDHSLEDVMQKVVDEVSALTGSHIGFLHLVEADETTIGLEAWSTETIEHFCRIDGAGMHYPLDEAGVWADAVRQRRPVIHDDYESLPNKKGMPEGHSEVKREMVLPVIRNEKIVAVIGVGNKEQEYTQQDIDVAGRFTDYAWDITERRRIETELAEERNQLARRVEERTADLSRANSNLARALRVKDEFLANMSHELRTPLNAILGLSESLGEQVAGPLNEKQSKYLSTINESGHHLLSLINDILDLAKIEAGQITLDINKVDINSVCQASLRMIKQLAQKKNQEVRFVVDHNLGLMWADERRLKQMIVNLLSNAVKFTPESGRLGLEVHGDEEANTISITVWDEGIGINENDVQRLFRPFVQLDAGLAREATGTGLGLALVAQMAQLHGGSVTLESQPGSGSRFTIRLPWQPAMAGETLARLKSTGKFRAIRPGEVRPTILLIEDTQEVVMMLVDYLEMAGFNMVTAQDGIDGLTQAKIAHPDLILMDIQMPRMDGFETTQKLRSDPEFKETPIIALTALAMPNDRQHCLDVGMNEYLSKPVNLKELSKTIKAFLYESEGNQS